jgi:Flp pilus assembly protein TadG
VLRGQGGQSLVEYALTLPVLVFALLGASDLARAYALELAVQNGARAGAEAAAIDTTPTESETIARAKDEMDRTPGMSSSQATVTVLMKGSGGADCIDPPTALAPCWVTVRVRYTFNTITPWPLVPNTATFDRSTTIRTMKGGTLPP